MSMSRAVRVLLVGNSCAAVWRAAACSLVSTSEVCLFSFVHATQAAFNDSLHTDSCLHTQRCNELEFAKAWPAIREFGPYGSAVQPDAASSSSEPSDPIEQALLRDALDTFFHRAELTTGTVADSAGKSSDVSIILRKHQGRCKECQINNIVQAPKHSCGTFTLTVGVRAVTMLTAATGCLLKVTLRYGRVALVLKQNREFLILLVHHVLCLMTHAVQAL